MVRQIVYLGLGIAVLAGFGHVDERTLAALAFFLAAAIHLRLDEMERER